MQRRYLNAFYACERTVLPGREGYGGLDMIAHVKNRFINTDNVYVVASLFIVAAYLLYYALR